MTLWDGRWIKKWLFPYFEGGRQQTFLYKGTFLSGHYSLHELHTLEDSQLQGNNTICPHQGPEFFFISNLKEMKLYVHSKQNW